MYRSFAIALVFLVSSGAMLHAETPAAPRLVISLDQALQSALDTSDQWKAANLAAAGATDQALAQRGILLPHLAVNGSYRYVTEIPALQVSPGTPPIAFTTHNQYSIGPDLTWTAFSGGAIFQ